jgi:hypothetical protein
MAYEVVIPANPALANSTEDFLHAVEHDRDNSAELFIRMADHLSDRMISLFLVEPSRMVTLSANQQRVIDFAVSTAGKASHMLTRQIFKKVSNREFAPVVENVKQIHHPADNEDHPAVMRFPVDERFGADFRKAAALCMEGRGTSDLELVSSSMDGLTDRIIDTLFVENTRKVKIGYVTQKALNVGVDGSKKAVHAVSHKVLKSLDDDKLKAFMDHYQGIVRATD